QAVTACVHSAGAGVGQTTARRRRVQGTNLDGRRFRCVPRFPPGTAMKVLLDTHTFIWWNDEPSKLSSQANAVLGQPGGLFLLSVVSAWEIQIKVQLRKMS